MSNIELRKSLDALLEPFLIEDGDIVFVSASTWPFLIEFQCSAVVFCEELFNALTSRIGPNGTIVVPTHSLNICNTNICFDPITTPSHHRGEFSEYIRKLEGAHRSFHPFASYSAYGSESESIVNTISKFAYGLETPEARLVDYNAKRVGIGLDITVTTSIHHIEQIVSVPYRYMKEFIHPVVRQGEIIYEQFYLHVLYKNMDIKSSYNNKIFSEISPSLGVIYSSYGRINAYSYSCAALYKLAIPFFLKDPFIWADAKPSVMPYRI